MSGSEAIARGIAYIIPVHLLRVREGLCMKNDLHTFCLMGRHPHLESPGHRSRPVLHRYLRDVDSHFLRREDSIGHRDIGPLPETGSPQGREILEMYGLNK